MLKYNLKHWNRWSQYWVPNIFSTMNVTITVTPASNTWGTRVFAIASGRPMLVSLSLPHLFGERETTLCNSKIPSCPFSFDYSFYYDYSVSMIFFWLCCGCRSSCSCCCRLCVGFGGLLCWLYVELLAPSLNCCWFAV